MPLGVSPRLLLGWRGGAGRGERGGGMVQRDIVQARLGDPFGAVTDRGDRGEPDQHGQRGDRSRSPGVQVGREAGQRPRLVVVKSQHGVEPGDQIPPLGAVPGGGVRVGPGVDGDEPAGELPAADAVEQAGPGGVDAGVHEGGRDVLGQEFQVVAGVGAGPGVMVQIMDFVDYQ